jgi:hypothetical protein
MMLLPDLTNERDRGVTALPSFWRARPQAAQSEAAIGRP